MNQEIEPKNNDEISQESILYSSFQSIRENNHQAFEIFIENLSSNFFSKRHTQGEVNQLADRLLLTINGEE